VGTYVTRANTLRIGRCSFPVSASREFQRWRLQQTTGEKRDFHPRHSSTEIFDRLYGINSQVTSPHLRNGLLRITILRPYQRNAWRKYYHITMVPTSYFFRERGVVLEPCLEGVKNGPREISIRDGSFIAGPTFALTGGILELVMVAVIRHAAS
jgi:hypothetical protein